MEHEITKTDFTLGSVGFIDFSLSAKSLVPSVLYLSKGQYYVFSSQIVSFYSKIMLLFYH